MPKRTNNTPDGLRQCGLCKKEGIGPKPFSDFCKGSGKGGLQNWCREHTRKTNREWVKKNPEKNRAKGKRFRQNNPQGYRKLSLRAQLKSAYKITEQDYEALFFAQEGKCAVCQTKLVSRSNFEREIRGHAPNNVARVDHCHETGCVRGLLCFSCNVGLGKFKDDENLLLRALRYLQKCNRKGGEPERSREDPS